MRNWEVDYGIDFKVLKGRRSKGMVRGCREEVCLKSWTV